MFLRYAYYSLFRMIINYSLIIEYPLTKYLKCIFANIIFIKHDKYHTFDKNLSTLH